MSLRFMEKIRKNIVLLLLFSFAIVFSQEDTDSTTEEMASEVASVVVKDTVVAKRMKLDGIAAVIGDYVILDSDIEKTLVDLRNQGASTEDVTHCQLLGKLMEDRLYAHQAVQDSLLVSDDQVNATSDRQIQQLVQQVGSMEKVLKFYKKPDIESFRAELFDINKLRILSEKMQTEITKEIEVTPEEVRQFFYKIPEDERPIFGAELEIAQIVKQPKAPEAEVQKIIDRLERIKQDVEENGSSFRIKAVLNTRDEPSRANGGFYTVTRQTPFVKEFKDVAFSLREGEISEPFETQYGYHIIMVEKIRGREVDLRHILMIPEIPDSAMKEAAKELDTIRNQLIDGKYTFAEGAQNFSDEKETRNDGGVLRNPIDFGSRFELTKMDPTLYNQIRDLKDNEISRPLREDDPRGGAPKFKIMKITNRYDEHKADFAKDYLKIQELALREKQYKAIKEWMSEHIEDTYIHVDVDNRGCDFTNNWVKQ